MKTILKSILIALVFSLFGCAPKMNLTNLNLKKQMELVLKKQILDEAAWAMQQEPITVSATFCPRSAGGTNDFYSEGDYWWPDSKNPEAPYIQKDGLTNPENFVAHRLAMIRFSKIIGALASAYKITGNTEYVQKAKTHLNAWFVNEQTKMNPNLQFAQAIKGRFTGRGIGIIDTIHLMEVAQGTLVIQDKFDSESLFQIKKWFSDYLSWMMNSANGKEEMSAKNNHGTCFVMQVASFAKLTGDKSLMEFCSNRFKEVLLPNQMAENGSFPLELARTKPYGYSIFNLDAMTTICQILTTKKDNLWQYNTADGKNIKTAIAYLQPYIADKSKWALVPDIMYFNDWPVAQPSLLFGAIAYNKNDWFDTWKALEHQPKVQEVIRNLAIKNPIIWVE